MYFEGRAYQNIIIASVFMLKSKQPYQILFSGPIDGIQQSLKESLSFQPLCEVCLLSYVWRFVIWMGSYGEIMIMFLCQILSFNGTLITITYVLRYIALYQDLKGRLF